MSKFIRLATGQHLNLDFVEQAWIQEEKSGYNSKYSLQVKAEHQTYTVHVFKNKANAEAALMALFPPVNVKLPE